jgi:hypothetical protein
MDSEFIYGKIIKNIWDISKMELNMDLEYSIY